MRLLIEGKQGSGKTHEIYKLIEKQNLTPVFIKSKKDLTDPTEKDLSDNYIIYIFDDLTPSFICTHEKEILKLGNCIITTDDIKQLPESIRKGFEIKKLTTNPDALMTILENICHEKDIEIDPEVLRKIAEMCGGNIRKAKSAILGGQILNEIEYWKQLDYLFEHDPKFFESNPNLTYLIQYLTEANSFQKIRDVWLLLDKLDKLLYKGKDEWLKSTLFFGLHPNLRRGYYRIPKITQSHPHKNIMNKVMERYKVSSNEAKVITAYLKLWCKNEEFQDKITKELELADSDCESLGFKKKEEKTTLENWM